MRKKWIISCITGWVIMAGTVSAQSLAELFPDEVRGWRPAEEDSVYTAENLYDYINGGAEVYRAFHVQKVRARRYERPGQPDIITDVFEMGSSEDAWGVYHHDIREGTSAGIGRESEYLDGTLSFWKGRFFVSILPFDETEESSRAVMEIGEKIAGRIPGEGSPPELLKVLPDQGLRRHSTRFFHDHHLMGRHFFLARENILHLSGKTDGLLAGYDLGGETTTLIVVSYPSERKASAAAKSFQDAILPDAGEDGMALLENQRWTAARRTGRHWVGVFDAPDRQAAENLLQNTIRNLKDHQGGCYE
jgi:hypothetical protein